MVGGREDLMDRGVLEASQLKTVFARLEEEKGDSITTVQDLLKWTVIDSAVKEGVVSFTVLFSLPFWPLTVTYCAECLTLDEPALPDTWCGGRSGDGGGGRCSFWSTVTPLNVM